MLLILIHELIHNNLTKKYKNTIEVHKDIDKIYQVLRETKLRRGRVFKLKNNVQHQKKKGLFTLLKSGSMPKEKEIMSMPVEQSGVDFGDMAGYEPNIGFLKRMQDHIRKRDLLLDDFRAFRHKFRHSYSFELDWEKEQIVARKLPKTLSLLRGQIKLFLQSLDQIENE